MSICRGRSAVVGFLPVGNLVRMTVFHRTDELLQTSTCVSILAQLFFCVYC